jgi:hypothetical protein
MAMFAPRSYRSPPDLMDQRLRDEIDHLGNDHIALVEDADSYAVLV